MIVPIVSRLAALAGLALFLNACGASSSGRVLQPGQSASPAPSSAASRLVAREVQPTCVPTQLRLALTWHRDPTGSLDTQFITTSEACYGPNALRPGRSATSVIGWGGWCGKLAGPQVKVSWWMQWEGKPDTYHALQATLIPRLPLTSALAAALGADQLY